jgi:hypothetical protein
MPFTRCRYRELVPAAKAELQRGEQHALKRELIREPIEAVQRITGDIAELERVTHAVAATVTHVAVNRPAESPPATATDRSVLAANGELVQLRSRADELLVRLKRAVNVVALALPRAAQESVEAGARSKRVECDGPQACSAGSQPTVADITSKIEQRLAQLEGRWKWLLQNHPVHTSARAYVLTLLTSSLC